MTLIDEEIFLIPSCIAFILVFTIKLLQLSTGFLSLPSSLLIGFILSTRLGSSHDNSLARLKICIIFFIVFKSCLQSLAKNICSK